MTTDSDKSHESSRYLSYEQMESSLRLQGSLCWEDTRPFSKILLPFLGARWKRKKFLHRRRAQNFNGPIRSSLFMARVGKYSKQVAGLMMFIHRCTVPFGLLRKLNPAHQNNCQVRVRVWRSRWRSLTAAYMRYWCNAGACRCSTCTQCFL